MHPPYADLSRATSEALIDQARKLNALGVHMHQEIRRWQPALDTWRGSASFAQHRSIEALKLQIPAVVDRIVRAAQLLEALGRAISVAREELDRMERAVSAASAVSYLSDRSLEEVDELRRWAAARTREIADELRALDLGTANQIDDTLTVPLRATPPLPQPLRPEISRLQLVSAIAATRKRIERHVESLEGAITEAESRPLHAPSAATRLTHLQKALALHRRLLAPERQILEWDPAGDGRIVEVFGDLREATHIAVVVPGILNTIGNFDRVHGPRSKDLWGAASETDSRVAVVAWLGYDAPEVANAVSKSRAIEQESALRAFVERLPSDAHVTVVAHSYGTVLAAEAAAKRLRASDVVMLGSPGTRFDQADQMRLDPEAQVWAGVSDTDRLVGRSSFGSIFCPEIAIDAGWLTPARWIISPVSIPVSRSIDACRTDVDGDVKGLAHGTNPAHEDFGAIEIDTTGADGHSSYFDPDSPTLDEIARIVTGTHQDQD